jgi:hypothetical protein
MDEVKLTAEQEVRKEMIYLAAQIMANRGPSVSEYELTSMAKSLASYILTGDK